MDETSFHGDVPLKNCTLLYFQLKLLFIFEAFEAMANIWSSLFSIHFGPLQHALSLGISLTMLILALPPFIQSVYILLQRNFPVDRDLEEKIKRDVAFMDGVE